MSKRGRPTEWTPKRIEAAKPLYLQLIAQGLSEHKIDAVEEMPAWEYRRKWQQDNDFLAQLKEARRDSAYTRMSDAERRLEYAYERAVEDSASPQLVTAAQNFAKFQSMVAAKLDRETWGEKVINEITPGEGVTRFSLSIDTSKEDAAN